MGWLTPSNFDDPPPKLTSKLWIHLQNPHENPQPTPLLKIKFRICPQNSTTYLGLPATQNLKENSEFAHKIQLPILIYLPLTRILGL